MAEDIVTQQLGAFGTCARSGADRTLLELWGASFKVVPGPAQFQGGLRIGADCSTHEHWADCGLHFGHP
eukprot:13469088-Alexandrium_andersonii.AAC.1